MLTPAKRNTLLAELGSSSRVTSTHLTFARAGNTGKEENGGNFRGTRMNSEEQNKILDAWQTSARYWDKYRVLIAQMFAPLTSGLVEEARIAVGQEVLDIGGGR